MKVTPLCPALLVSVAVAQDHIPNNSYDVVDISPAMCDIDGSGVVDVADYSILSTNFDQIEVTL